MFTFRLDSVKVLLEQCPVDDFCDRCFISGLRKSENKRFEYFEILLTRFKYLKKKLKIIRWETFGIIWKLKLQIFGFWISLSLNLRKLYEILLNSIQFAKILKKIQAIFRNLKNQCGKITNPNSHLVPQWSTWNPNSPSPNHWSFR